MQPDWSQIWSEASSTAIGAVEDRRWQRVEVDPVTLQVVGGALRAIAGEMAASGRVFRHMTSYPSKSLIKKSSSQRADSEECPWRSMAHW